MFSGTKAALVRTIQLPSVKRQVLKYVEFYLCLHVI